MEYQIVKSVASPENILRYSQLLSEVFSHTPKFTPEFLDWQYNQNPLGGVIGTDAFINGKLVAHHATLPSIYSIAGKLCKSLIPANNVTHPAHQGKNLFTTLGRASFEEGRQQGYEFVITPTNQNSTHGYINKFGFKPLAPLEVKIGIGKIIPGNPFDHKVHAHWSDEYLSWRLLNPTANYYFDGRTVIAKTFKPGVYAQITNRPLPLTVHLPIKKSLINLWIGMSNSVKTKGLFIDLPEKFKPAPLNLLYKDLQGTLPDLSKEDIFFELLDFDAF